MPFPMGHLPSTSPASPTIDDEGCGPKIVTAPPGPRSQAWLRRAAETGTPMGPTGTGVAQIVYESGRGSYVVDVDGNRYVDLAAGFGALLLGHGHRGIVSSLLTQAERLLIALGDIYPSEARLRLEQDLLRVLDLPSRRVLFGQSGSDAVTAALKTATLATGRPGIVAFSGGYHGLGYGPLAACGLRESYRVPFAAQLNAHVRFLSYPTDLAAADRVLDQLVNCLGAGDIAAILVEPVLGRGGCLVPPPGFLVELGARAHASGAVIIADEIWTGLGRSGSWLSSRAQGLRSDLVCLGKGLGGGLPISACIGDDGLMQCWSRPEEVVHTATFSGAPLAAASASTTLEMLAAGDYVQRSSRLGSAWLTTLRSATEQFHIVREVRGQGLMIGIELEGDPGAARAVMVGLLRRGYLVTCGGGQRHTVVLTPPLSIAESELAAFCTVLAEVLTELRP